MQVFHFHRDHLPEVNAQHLNLVYNQEVFLPYIQQTFSLEHFEKQIDLKEDNYTQKNRGVLVKALQKQYENVEEKDGVMDKIQLLQEANTFTVTTGHQLSLFTGPLYFVIKILHVIKLSKELKKNYPDYNFVPVYWMASEDHDFEEIQSMNLFGKKFTWESTQKGAVGRFSTEGLEEVKMKIKEMFQNHPNAEIHSLLDAYSGDNFAEATRNLVHFLFKKYDLIILDGDDRSLKQFFIPMMKKELEESFAYHAVNKTNKDLVRDGAKIQVHAREVNLFYLKEGIRNRIIKRDNHFEIEDVGNFSLTEIIEELENYPERFSPNVILRPLYQEFILPNLAYVGGVGEISYWLQLKGVFDAVQITYPLISVRNSVFWIDAPTAKRMMKIDMKLECIFKPKDLIKKEYILHHEKEALNFELFDKRLQKLKDELSDLVLGVDESKTSFISAENARLDRQMENYKSKLIKMSKGRHDNALKQIDHVKDKLFPNGNLQERVVNFFSFSPDGNYTSRLDKLYAKIDPIKNDFLILREIDFREQKMQS